MSVIVVGVNHRTVALEMLEQLAVPGERLPKALHDLVSREHIAEAVVLSTCNRTEVYAECLTFHGALSDITNALATACGVGLNELQPHLFVKPYLNIGEQTQFVTLLQVSFKKSIIIPGKGLV